MNTLIIAKKFRKSTLFACFFHSAYKQIEQDQHPGSRKAGKERDGGGGKRPEIGLAAAGGAGFVQMVQAGLLFIKLLDKGVVHGLMPPDALGHLLNEFSGGVPQGGGAVENRGDEGIVHMIQQKPGGFYFYPVIGVVVLAGAGEIILILLCVLGRRGDRDIALRLRIGDLHLVGEKELG